jgi:hypothetical protein
MIMFWMLQPMILKSVFGTSISVRDFCYPVLFYRTSVRACTSMLVVGGEYSGNNNGGNGNCWL